MAYGHGASPYWKNSIYGLNMLGQVTHCISEEITNLSTYLFFILDLPSRPLASSDRRLFLFLLLLSVLLVVNSPVGGTSGPPNSGVLALLLLLLAGAQNLGQLSIMESLGDGAEGIT